MSRIKIGVIEDEVIIADHLCHILNVLGYDTTEPAASFAEAISMIETERPDLVLIDIRLKGKKDGIDLAHKVKEDFDIPFIFLTANSDAATVQRAKLAEPPAYLVKPFNQNDLYTAIEICLYNAAQNKNKQKEHDNFMMKETLFIKEGQSFHKVKFADILYLESEHVYVQVHSKEKKYLVRSAMQDYLELFDKNKFFRTHRSYVINTDHIQTIHPEHVMINGVQIPIGKNYREELFSRLKVG